MEDNYFDMDSFNRSTLYSCSGAGGQSAQRKYLDLEGLQTYDTLAQNRTVSITNSLQDSINELTRRVDKLESKAVSAVSSAFVIKKLKRADLNLVFK